MATVRFQQDEVLVQRAKVLRQEKTALCSFTKDLFPESQVLSSLAEPVGRADNRHFPKIYAEALETNHNRPATTHKTQAIMATAIKSTPIVPSFPSAFPSPFRRSSRTPRTS
jgi:hypothetical protein